MGKAFWLGIIGGILGILIAMVVYVIAFNFDTSLYTNVAGAFIFSIVGMAGGILEKRKMLGAALMFIGGVGVLISISFYGILTLVLFVVGGIIILMQKKEQPAVAPPMTGQNTE